MLTTLIKKEILESFFSYRFLFGTLLCVIVIPVGVYVNLREYERRQGEYQDLQRLSLEQNHGVVGRNFHFEGYRPPSLMSIFTAGLDNILPNKVTTDKNAGYQIERELGAENPDSLLFGKMDLVFNVGFIVSLLGFILTFNSISGEKEDATLRLMLSNPVPRWHIILAKIAGNYAVLLIPLLFSFIIVLIIVNSSGVSSVFSPDILPPFLVLSVATMLFILSLCALGILCSTLTHRARTSIVALLLTWALLILAWPKISPMIAGIIYPVRSQEVHNFEKMLARQNHEKELESEEQRLFDKIVIAGYGLDVFKVFNPRTELERRVQAIYDSARGELVKKYDMLISGELRELDLRYSNERTTQSSIAKNLSRLSPLCCYMYVATDVSATGTLEMKNFIENAGRFQSEAKEAVYDKMVEHLYGGTKGASGSSTGFTAGFDPDRAPVPQLTYQRKTLREAMSGVWGDIVLLALYGLVFFTLGSVSFMRYDVR